MKKTILALVSALGLTALAESITLTVASGTQKTLDEALSAAGHTVAELNGGALKSYTIVKDGEGILDLTTAIASFVGSWDIQAGQVNCTAANVFGAASASVTVRAGATVKMTNTNKINDGRKFFIAGTGLDNQGALTLSGTGTATGWSGPGVFGNVELIGDATVASGGFYYAGDSINLKGHTYTIKRYSSAAQAVRFKYVTGPGHVVFDGTYMRCENNGACNLMDATPGNSIIFKDNAGPIFFSSYLNGTGKNAWTFDCTSGSASVFQGDDSNRVANRESAQNHFFTPVNLGGSSVQFTNQGNTPGSFFYFEDLVSGGASWTVGAAAEPTYVHLLCPTNTFTGKMSIDRAVVSVYEPGSLPTGNEVLLKRDNDVVTTTSYDACDYLGLEMMSVNPYGQNKLSYGGDKNGRVQGGTGKWNVLQKDGTGTLEYFSAMNADRLLLSAGTLKLPRGLKPGLCEGRKDFATAADARAVLSTLASADCPAKLAVRGVSCANAIYEQNYTPMKATRVIVCTGYVWNRTSAARKMAFASNVDGPAILKVGGTTLLDGSVASGFTDAEITLAPGATAFEYRVSASVPVTARKGFLYRLGGKTGNLADYQACIDPGDGSLFTQESAAAGTLSFGDVTASATLDVNGNTVAMTKLSGAPTVKTSATDAGTASGLTLGELVVNAADAAAGRFPKVEVPLSFGATGVISVTNCATLADGVYTIVHANAPIDFGGRELASLVTIDGEAGKWTVEASEGGCALVLHRNAAIELPVTSGSQTMSAALTAYNTAHGTSYTMADFGGTLKGYDIVKSGTGTMTLDAALSGFVGRFVVRAGVVNCNVSNAFGPASVVVVVENGAQLKIATSVTNAGRTFIIAGSGPDGKGALVGPGPRVNYGTKTYFGDCVKLSANATMTVGEWFYIADTAVVPNGFKLTVKSTASPSTFDGKYLPQIIGPGELEMDGASWRTQGTVALADATPGNKISCVNGGGFRFWNTVFAGAGMSTWALDFKSGTCCFFGDETGTMTRESGQNTFYGPVNVASGVTVELRTQNNTENGRIYLKGPLSGSGALYDNGFQEPMYLHFLNSANTYSGTYTMRRGVGYVYAPGTFPKAASMKLDAVSGVIRHTADKTSYGIPDYYGAAFHSPAAYDLGNLTLAGAYTNRVQCGTGVRTEIEKRDAGVAEYYSAVGTEKLTLSAGTFKLPRGVKPGLYEGVQDFTGYTAVTSAFAGASCPQDLVMRGVHSANADNEYNYTEPRQYRLITYKGYVWNRTGAAAQWSIASSVNGGVKVKVGGETLISTTTAGLQKATVTLQPGATSFEYRGFNNSPRETGWVAKKGFACKWGAASDSAADYALGIDPGDGSLFTLTDGATETPLALGDATFAAGATLDLNGAKAAFTTLAGPATIVSTCADALADPEVTVTDALAADPTKPMTFAGTLRFGADAKVTVTVPKGTSRSDDGIALVTADAIDLGGRSVEDLMDFGAFAARWKLGLSADGKTLMLIPVHVGLFILVK